MCVSLDLLSRLHVWVRTDLSSYLEVVEMHTWCLSWKRGVIVIIVIFVNVCM
jgi:hypothetical protein